MANGLIWILEDDDGCRFVYDEALGKQYKIRHFTGLKSFSSALNGEGAVLPDLIITDLILEDGSFLEHIQENSQEISKLNIPFIVVSNIDETDALRSCFNQGALDYLTKPFKKSELIVKVEKVFLSNRKFTAGTYRSVYVDQEEVTNLTVKQKELLEMFLAKDNRTITRDEILDNIWGGVNVHPKTVDVHLYNLRRKLEGHGYAIRSEGVGQWSLISRLKPGVMR